MALDMILKDLSSIRAGALAALIVAIAAAVPARAADPRLAGAARERPAAAEAGTYRTHAGETLLDIARRFDLGFVELRAANPGVDPWMPPPGTELAIPTVHLLPAAPHKGIVVNLAEQRLYLFGPSGALEASFPVGIGREGWTTPLGRMTIVGKKYLPVWTVPASIRAEKPYLPERVLPGPANPLGKYAMYLSATGIVIHGTNLPDGIGRRVSHGCIRMYPEDVKRLFGLVSVGTEVDVIDQPVKLAWKGGALLLEAHPTQAQADLVEEGRPLPPPRLGDALSLIRFAAGAHKVDMERTVAILKARRGMPERIAGPSAVGAEARNAKPGVTSAASTRR